MKESADSVLVGLETVNQVLLKAGHAVGQDAHAVEQVADDRRLEDVELELAVHTTNGSGDVVTHNLGANHGEGLALGRVNLARHDRRAGLVLRKNQLVQTAARTRSEVTDVLSNLEERTGKSVEGTGSLDDRVVCSQNLELVGGGLELGTGELGNLSGDSLVEALESVQTGTDSSTTLSKVAKVGNAGLNALNVAVELSNVSGELLTKGQGGSVLQVGTTDLDDVAEVLNLHLKGVAQASQRRQEGVLELDNGGDVHGSGEGVVGRGRHVDVVVGVDGLLGTHGATEDLNGTVRDDLVGVHVGLGAGAGLPNDKREVVQQLAFRDLSGGLLDGLTNLGVLGALVNATLSQLSGGNCSYQGQSSCSQ